MVLSFPGDTSRLGSWSQCLPGQQHVIDFARYTAREYVLQQIRSAIVVIFNTDDAHLQFYYVWTGLLQRRTCWSAFEVLDDNCAIEIYLLTYSTYVLTYFCHAAIWTDCSLPLTLPHVSQLACGATITYHTAPCGPSPAADASAYPVQAESTGLPPCTRMRGSAPSYLQNSISPVASAELTSPSSALRVINRSDRSGDTTFNYGWPRLRCR